MCVADVNARRGRRQVALRSAATRFAVAVDVADSRSVRGDDEATAERYGGIDVLYNNAGISPATTPRSSRPSSTRGSACRT